MHLRHGFPVLDSGQHHSGADDVAGDCAELLQDR
jgi:hypothetical protein